MMRRADGNWEIGHREFKLLVFFFPLLQVVFTAGAAWAGVKLGLDTKVDKAEFAAHAQQTALQFQALRINDSLQQAAAAEDRVRIREIVCEAVHMKACR